MFPLLENVSLNAEQSVAATRLLLHVAQVDGAKAAEEVALIRLFYEGVRSGNAYWPAFDTLQAAPQGGEFARTFDEAAQRDIVIATSLMVAYADGVLTSEELAAVYGVAAQIGTPAARVDELLALVKDHMLAQLSRLPDAGSVAAVARELG